MPKTVKSVKPNAGIENAYAKALKKIIDEMQKSATYWVTAQYRKAPPRVAEIAEDAASPSAQMQKRLTEIADGWKKRFEEVGLKISELYVKDMFKTADSAFMKSLKGAGWSVKFQITPAMRDALNSSVEANVELIKSIPDQYFLDLQGSVMRAYSTGRDLETLTKEIREIYPVTKKRAEFIARDQTNKATSVASRTRQLELGIEEAIWMHSGAGKHPRPEHVKANGERFNLKTGMLIDGKYIFPGEEPNCRCTSRPVLPF